MAETELIKLKKEIHHLREQNAYLQGELEEKNEKLGKMETEYLKMKNETMLVTKTKLMQHQEMIKLNVEKVLENERARINFLEKNNEEAIKKIAYLEQEKINLEGYQKEMQIQSNQLKKQLKEFGEKTQTTEFIKDLRDRDEVLMKKETEYQKMVYEWNKLCDRMEDILSENRLLKELANVPANFGINIEEIKLGDRMKIEDYKAKIRILQREVDELETERAQLKHKMIFLSNALEIKEPPFNKLTTEQKKTIADYAQSLYEGREFIVPERYELMKDNQNLKTKIEFLEKQIATMQLESSYRIYGFQNQSAQKGEKGSSNIPDHFKEIIDMLRKENEDLKALLSKSLDKISNFNEEMMKSNFNATQPKNENLNTSQKVEFSYLQIPPFPMVDQKDVDNTGYAFSYKFNTKFKIDPNQIHSLFGIAKDDSDVDALKIESASLQTQLIELMEVVSRIQNQDGFLNENLEKLYNKLENIVLLQNELFERYTSEKKHFRTVLEENTKTNKSLMEELHDIKRKDKALEDTISLIETKNLSQIENRAIEKMKESSILEVNYIKLLRKYEALLDEESKMRKLAEETEKNSIDKDLQLENTIIKLKEWKQILNFYLKFLTKKLKKSVDKEEFNKVLDENKYLREKYNEMVIRDINITKQVSLIENLKIKLKEMEQNFYNSEEMRIDCEIELNYMKKKLQEVDPSFYIQEKMFRKFIQVLNELRLSFTDIKRVFDPNNSGKISKIEFISALTSLNMSEHFLEGNEADILIQALNIDDENNIDSFYFIRKLERIGVIEDLNPEGVSNDEKTLQEFVEGVKNSGMSLRSVFELFDSSGDGLISREEFKFALQQLNFNVNEEFINKILILINGATGAIPNNDGRSNTNAGSFDKNEFVNYNQFCELFDQRSRYISLKNKNNSQIKTNLKIDWKTNLVSKIVEGIRENELTYMEAFKYLDKDNSGSITREEFTFFIRRINVNFSESEIDNLFKLLDKNSDGKIEADEFITVLRECEDKIQMFKNITHIDKGKDSYYKIDSFYPPSKGNNDNSSVNKAADSDKMKNKHYLLMEREKYYLYKINQMRNRLEEMEKINKETGSQLEEYVNKHSEMMEKYFSASEEMQKLKSIYEFSGVKREDLTKIEMENDNLTREVTVLRVGLNTFKDLYKSCGRQNQVLNVKAQRNEDEVDTYKKAVKDLQSESNQNALVGKLYYSLLISRWREASSIRKYDDLINEFATLREENFKCETENKQILKDVTELQTVLHDKIIENLRLEEQLENVTHGFGASGSGMTHEQLEELKQLMRELSLEKTQLTEKYFTIRRENLRLQVELDEIRNKVEYSDALVSRIKFSNTDEYSKKLISLSEELSRLKLNENVLTRENFFIKETENHLNRLNEHLNKNVKKLEVTSSEWEGKFRKMEEVWRKKDDERQKKFFDYIKGLNLNEMKIMVQSSGSGSSLNLNNVNKLNEYENKVREMHEIIIMKNNEINNLINANKENEQLLKEQANNLIGNKSVFTPLLSQNNLEYLKEDETQLVAQTAHKTIKTLQDLLDSKNTQLKKKDEVIENLRNDNIRMKEYYLNVVNKLQEQIHLEHDSTMKKLKNVLENVNQNLLIKISKSQLSTMTLADIEGLIEEKDNAIKTLAVELKHSKEENEINYLKIQDLNKRITDLSMDINEKKFYSGVEMQNEEVERLKRVIKEKSDLIEVEKARIQNLSQEFSRKIQDRTLVAEEHLFRSSVVIPERLVENSEKNQLYAKIQSLRNKNKKLRAEIEKLNKSIEDYKKHSEDFNKNTEKIKNESKLFLQTQIKDTKTISRLKKEKEDLNAEKDKLKEKMEQMQKLLDTQTANLSKTNPVVNKRPSSVLRRKIVPEKKEEKEVVSPVIQQVIKVSNVDIVKTSQPHVAEENAEDILKRLVYYCLKKNINMSRHLQRYDLTKIGKLTRGDFTKALDELKLGFIESDIKKLTEISKISDDYLEIQSFIQMMIEKDKNYGILIKENEYMFDPNSIMKRQPSKKYSPFENKSFNINY